MAKKRRTRKVVRDTRSGEFVPTVEARRRPATTVTETVPLGRELTDDEQLSLTAAGAVGCNRPGPCACTQCDAR